MTCFFSQEDCHVNQATKRIRVVPHPVTSISPSVKILNCIKRRKHGNLLILMLKRKLRRTMLKQK